MNFADKRRLGALLETGAITQREYANEMRKAEGLPPLGGERNPMTSEEISKLKREAEQRIWQELELLVRKTGMQVENLDLGFIDTTEIGGFERRHVTGVRIDLRVP